MVFSSEAILTIRTPVLALTSDLICNACGLPPLRCAGQHDGPRHCTNKIHARLVTDRHSAKQLPRPGCAYWNNLREPGRSAVQRRPDSSRR